MLRTGSPFVFTKPEPAIYWVQNKQATLNEWVVAQVLDKYGITYVFQASYLGGRTIRGGYVVDFMVDIPYEVPLEVFGGYWHMGQLGMYDKLKLDVLENFFGQKVRIVWGNESQDIPSAIAALRRERVIR